MKMARWRRWGACTREMHDSFGVPTCCRSRTLRRQYVIRKFIHTTSRCPGTLGNGVRLYPVSL